jgi:hypothetical protein
VSAKYEAAYIHNIICIREHYFFILTRSLFLLQYSLATEEFLGGLSSPQWLKKKAYFFRKLSFSE